MKSQEGTNLLSSDTKVNASDDFKDETKFFCLKLNSN